MTSVGSGQTRSAQEFLTGLDDAWTDELRLVSLVAEVLDAIDEADLKTGLRVIGARYGAVGWSERGRMLRRWPAVQVVLTSYVAAERYAHGGLWPQLKELLHAERLGQGFNEEWGGAFLRNLQTLGMPTFLEQGEEAGQRYVGRMLLHSGVPTFCLADLFKLIAEWQTRDPGITPSLLVARASDRYAAGKLFNVDKPVGRFFRFGGEFAVDIVDRCFDLLDMIGAGGDPNSVPLPERFKRVALELRDAGLTVVTSRARTSSTSVEQGVRPQLVVEPFGRGLMLRLPPVGGSPDGRATWHVTLGDELRTVQTAALTPGANEPAPQTDVPIPAPIRLATAALDRRPDLTFPVSVVDDRKPLLVFDDGSRMATTTGVPGRPLWLLFAGGSTSLTLSGDAPILSESLLPPGWSGWTLLYVDLTTASQVELPAFGVQLLVRGEANARIATDEPVVGARTARGNPVFASVPEIRLPEGFADAQWSVDILDGNGSVIATWRHGQANANPNAV